MNKFTGRVFSAALTLTLAASYYFDSSYALTFVSVIFWMMVALMFFMSIGMISYFSKFDDGTLKAEDCEKMFGKGNKISFLGKVYNTAMTVLQVLLLVILGSPILAAFYLTANVAAKMCLSGVEKRSKSWLDKNKES